MLTSNTMKTPEGDNQKFRPRWPRRTIEEGRLRDVQCRPPFLPRSILERPEIEQGKYEEEKETKCQRAEGCRNIYRLVEALADLEWILLFLPPLHQSPVTAGNCLAAKTAGQVTWHKAAPRFALTHESILVGQPHPRFCYAHTQKIST